MNCKPGDMAVVLQAKLPQNIGLIVEVLERGFMDNEDGWTWRVKAAWPCTAVNTLSGLRRTVTEASVRDAWLKPIRPPETPVEETLDAELTV